MPSDPGVRAVSPTVLAAASQAALLQTATTTCACRPLEAREQHGKIECAHCGRAYFVRGKGHR